MTKLSTTLLKDLPIKQTSITDEDYVVVSSGGTKKLKVKDITKDVEKKAADLEVKTTELGSQLEHNTNEIENIDYISREKEVQGVVTFTFDDGRIEDYTHIYPLFKRKNITASIALVSDNVDKVGLNTVQIKQMEADGWEFASHSKTHSANLTTLTNEQLFEEVYGSKRDLKAKGINVKNMFVPYGFWNEQVGDAIAKYYRSGRVSGAGCTGSQNICPINTFRVNSIQLGDNISDSDNLTVWKAKVDEAYEKGYWLVFISHSTFIVNNNYMQDLETLIDYIKSKNIKIKTYDKALDDFSNKVDSKLFKVGADGKVNGMYGKIKRIPIDTLLNNSQFSEIEEECVTFGAISNGEASGFPNNTGGTRIIIKPDRDIKRTFEFFKSYANDKDLYFRGLEGDWVNLVVLNQVNNLPSSHLATELSPNKITVCTIYGSNTSGYPGAGVLMAYMLDGARYNCYEDFYLRESGRMFRRFWNDSTKIWSNWSELLTTNILPTDSVTSETPITAYLTGVSYVQITANKSNFPDGIGGQLETKRCNGHGYNHQYYHHYDSTKTYKRVWKSNQSWSEWALINS